MKAAFERLLITEGDRLRLLIELQDEESDHDGAAAAVMDEYDRGLRLAS